ncbi:MAG: MGDG synthase family glycosyltransferase [Jatrophihabitantaceae bacterium]
MSAPRVLVVGAGMGAGHTEVARELARRLDLAGAQPRVVDLLELAGAAGARLQRTYRLLLAHAAWLYDASMRFWARCPRAMQALTAAGAKPFDEALRREIGRFEPDVVISTYNLASQSLGRLARRGQVRAPIVTFVIDPGAHPYWVSEFVELHLAAMPATAAQLARFGARRVGVSPPVLRPEFASPVARPVARARLALADAAGVVLLNAGSWAAGNLDSTLDVVERIDGVLPVVLCGRNEAVRARLATRIGTRAVGWTADVATYLAAADAVVDNAGGQTCWEALSCGVPVLVYHPLPGHGRLNAEALDRAGLARWVHSPAQLQAALAQLGPGRQPAPAHFAGSDAVEHVLALAAGA